MMGKKTTQKKIIKALGYFLKKSIITDSMRNIPDPASFSGQYQTDHFFSEIANDVVERVILDYNNTMNNNFNVAMLVQEQYNSNMLDDIPLKKAVITQAVNVFLNENKLMEQKRKSAEPYSDPKDNVAASITIPSLNTAIIL
eukprot:Pgem_evm1s18406